MDIQHVNVKTYGVRGDIEFDDTDSLNLAINKEAIICIPAGTYLIKGKLDVRGVLLVSEAVWIIKECVVKSMGMEA